MLTDKARYRVTGFLFLAALVAIFLPMLLDGAGVAPVALEPVQPADFDVVPDTTPPPDMSEALEVRRELRAAYDDEGYARDTGTRIGAPVLVADSKAQDDEREPLQTLQWAVQVGSFSQHDNAEARREQLLLDGYAAFLSQVKRDGERATRVAVGPFLARADAERVKTELDSRYELASVVVELRL